MMLEQSIEIALRFNGYILTKQQQIQHPKMSRIQVPHNPINPDRINPQFIGVGQKLSEHKRNRLDSDKHRKTMESNFTFTLKLNQQLEKSLVAKEKELERLQNARRRHQEDINHKLTQEQKKQRELQQLRLRSKDQRDTIRSGIKSVRDELKSERLANKLITKQQLHEKSLQSKAENEAHLHQNTMKYKSVQMGKKYGNERINSYYRHKNLESYHNYVQMIEEEDMRNGSNLESIKRMHSQMKRLEKKIQKKQRKLKEVVQEINMYAVQCQNQRKVNFLATVSVFRPSSTTSSWRSRPTDILRTSIHKNKEEDDQRIDTN